MQCAKCGAENPDDAYFCGSCGTQLRSSFSASPASPVYDLTGSEPPAPPPANPFGAAEPNASQAYQELLGEPPASAPPPAPAYGQQTEPYNPAGAYPPPAPPQQYQPPPPQYQQYQPPPPPGQYQAPPGYGPAQGYGMPPDGNTSGMGQGYPVPPQASGWTFAGFLPWGLFSFFNGDTTWGVIGLVGSFIGILGIVYAIMVGINGKESAWRNRRFNSIYEYEATMRSWSNWGMGCLGAGCLGGLVYFVVLMIVIGTEGSR
jgi:hypothetical protein